MRWQPLQPAVHMHRNGTPVLPSESNGFNLCFRNREYVVLVRPQEPIDLGAGPLDLFHCSIRRVDRKAQRDWRHFQRIKNEIFGPEAEAIELYPAESRLVDEANQYHLYVITKGRFPFGMEERSVSGPGEAAAIGAKQRPFEED